MTKPSLSLSRKRIRRVVNVARRSSFTSGKYHRKGLGPAERDRKRRKNRSSDDSNQFSLDVSENKKKEKSSKRRERSEGGQRGDHIDELLGLSRTMADVFQRSLDAMQHLARDINNTAVALRALADAQRRQSEKSKKGQDSSVIGSTPGATYSKPMFTMGNKDRPVNREAMESNANQVVEIKVVFSKITEIDTINQVFEAEVYIQARWRETKFAGFTEEVCPSYNQSEL
ncbi:hypothetical protein PoB_002013000 [Plakobranchus ocellatus]|uniref:Uncharacterized protein n=1 Tax=Plakobranchus ocellatus TaxID=259542 RepID=A0AAV3ZGF7_9GAST|nr:hypothetical protein PoB_002013000 [Plakobranchus ocellatus]